MKMIKSVRFRHLAVIISVIIIALGMAAGTICHFLSDGFFNYGDEFASYKSVEVTTSTPEDITGDIVQKIAEDNLSSLGAYEVSFSLGTGYIPNTVIYKFYTSVSDGELANAVAAIQTALERVGMTDGTAAYFSNTGTAGGLYQLSFVAIALAAAVAFEAIYFALRYKPGMALSALLSQIVAVGLYAALLAITRCPVGIEAIAFSVLVVIMVMISNGATFNTVKKSYKDEANAKTDKFTLISEGARSTSKISLFVGAAVAVIAVVFGICAFIASPAVATLAPYAACLIAVVASLYTIFVFTPASYSLLSHIDRRKKS